MQRTGLVLELTDEQADVVQYALTTVYLFDGYAILKERDPDEAVHVAALMLMLGRNLEEELSEEDES